MKFRPSPLIKREYSAASAKFLPRAVLSIRFHLTLDLYLCWIPAMKSTAKGEQFATNAEGKRVGVLLDLRTYDRMREAVEELSDLRAYDAARPKALAEVKDGKFCELAEYASN